MARIPLFASALAAGLVLAVSPLASATGNERALTPAPGADMLEMAMCGDRDAVLTELKQQFDETPMAVGQVDANAVVEILVSDSGSWTILATGTDGKSCIVSAGEGFESAAPLPGLGV